ncbi:diguanylate cyclase domain-containing protein [Pseudogulbenkiania sp. MAI-1]|uniref:diguanylate cyclase domain-containing protein n=1 Tax=Pseudogulbenkiania sp. MAI-1 TaxID=990370 RepID=UPI00045E91CB|nr:diguanylate cyclase [Pseudogulbenkiania sp. MAI-1]
MLELHHKDAAMPLSNRYDVMVLLVDDQAIIGEAIRRALASQPDINFHFCSDPDEAIRCAEEIKPTVILQDLVLPGADGLTLVRQYRDNPATQDIPIVVLSTKEEPAVKSEAFRLGANDYLVKLPDPIELIARIRHHSKAYLNQIQRDDAYRALRESQQQLLEMNIELLRLTNVDGLTGLNNRKRFNEYLEAEWKRAVREQSPFALLMIDVDDFKRYNDTYGHLAGDDILKQVAETIQRSPERSTDLAARFGGEEFAVILPATPLSGTQYLGEKLRRDVEALHLVHEASSVAEFVTISVGGASITPQRGDSSLLLLEAADEALYEAKRLGKNRVITYRSKAFHDKEKK